MHKEYDVIVIGAGHAGCEAALAAARLGAQTLLITFNLDHIAQMSCNPAIGGVAKGHVVREIDALGGGQGIITDCAAIQFRLLNRTKGPAVWSPRAQCDKVCYQRAMKLYCETTPALAILQSEVTGFIVENGRLAGVTTQFEQNIRARAVVLTAGTFLRGKLHFGLRNYSGGRSGDPAATELSAALSGQLGLRLGRLKTGTPPRILGETIDFSQLEEQPAEVEPERFSYWSKFNAALPLPRVAQRAMACHMLYTTPAAAAIVRDNLDQAPMYQGKIEGIGARYCPSFEDKVVRFAHHERHLLFLEPEGEFTREYYINGFSTSLPPDVQLQLVHALPGLENAAISRYAYAIEYDFIFPDQTYRTLNSRRWENLFSAGQVNGTSGYEEAAAQGVLAGANAACYAAGRSLLEFSRDTSYIGVMVDDLVSKEIVEPYRLFTSRAEYRLHLRQDNADLRLCEFAYRNGLLPEAKYRYFAAYRDTLERALSHCRQTYRHGKPLLLAFKEFEGDYPVGGALPFLQPGELDFVLESEFRERILRELAINAHYDGYLAREEVAIARLRKLDTWRIPVDFDYRSIAGMRNESRAKLIKAAPATLAQASRLDGVTPAEIGLLQIHLTRLRGQTGATSAD